MSTILSILKDVSIDDLEDLDIEEFNTLLENTRFITKPLKNTPKSIISVDGVKLYRLENSRLTLGEFIDLENLMTNNLVDNLDVILTIFYRRRVSEGDMWSKPVMEPYGDWIYHRRGLFGDVPIQDVYGVISSYLSYRKMLFKLYAGLFNDSEDDGYHTIPDNETSIEKRERLKEEKREETIRKWNWDSITLKLASNDALKIDEVTNMSLIGAFNVLSLKKEMEIE